MMKKSYDEKVHELVSKHESVLIKIQDAIDQGVNVEDLNQGLEQVLQENCENSQKTSTQQERAKSRGCSDIVR